MRDNKSLCLKRVFLVRHGEPDNPKGLIYGRLPGFPLTDCGKKEALWAGEYIKEKLKGNPEVIFSSPLLRTRQTAVIINRVFPKAKIVFDERIQELDLGWWVGRTEEELVRMGVWQIYLEHPSRLKNGEGFKAAQERIVSWLKEVIEKREDKELVVVTHKDLIRLLTLFLEKRPIDDLNKIPCEMGSVTTIKIDQDLKLVGSILYREPDDFED